MRLLARVDPREGKVLPVFEFDEASLADFMRESNLDDSAAYKYSLKIMEELIGMTVFFKKDIDNERVSVKGRPVFREGEILYNKRTKKLENAKFEFTKDIESSIKNLSKNYTKLHLEVVSKIESKHAKRIYEILMKEHAITKRYRSSSDDRTRVKFSLDEFKWKLNLPNSYKRYDNLNKKVIKLAQKQIEENSNISFSYEPLREVGRGYSHIEFIVSDNQNSVITPVKAEQEFEPASLPELPPATVEMILGIIPDFPIKLFPVLAEYPRDLLIESLMDFTRAKLTTDIKQPVDYFLGIVKNKIGEASSENQRTHKSTIEQLTDTSWADEEIEPVFPDG